MSLSLCMVLGNVLISFFYNTCSCPASLKSLIKETIFSIVASLIGQLGKIHLQCKTDQFDYGVGKICWRMDGLPTIVFLGFPCGSAGKESAYIAGNLGSSPGLGRSPGEGKGYPLQYSGLENSMYCIVHGVAKSWTWLWYFHFHSLTSLVNGKMHIDV